MTVHWLTDMADVLSDAGLTVHENLGWQTCSFPNWPGYNPGLPSHIMCHHTASNPGSDGAGDVNYILHGASWGGPICNLYLDRKGAWWVIAAGRSATNGSGTDTWGGGVPVDMMNHYAIGIEAANNGIGEPWPKAQCDAYVNGVAALCRHYNIPAGHVRAHREWTPRKIDPAGPTPSHPTWGGSTGRNVWNMDAFRADVLRLLNPPAPPPPVEVVPPVVTPPPTPKDPDMAHTVKLAGNNAVLLVDGTTAVWVKTSAILSDLVKAGIAHTPVSVIAPATLSTFVFYGALPAGFTADQFAAHITN